MFPAGDAVVIRAGREEGLTWDVSWLKITALRSPQL